MKTKSTPMMRQYRQAKEASPDSIVLMRIGDFYEAFEEDAETIAKVLRLSLTKRGDVPMAGFPYYQQDAYVKKLVAAGFRVALAERTEL